MQGKHILLVDDYKDTRDMYQHFLLQAGFRVTVASNGQEGVEKTFELRPDLVIMDLSLPLVNGWEATRMIKSDQRSNQIPVVILSGHDLSACAAEIGCAGWLVKPCFPDILVAEISRVLKDKNAVHME
jgi:two-component system, cell cycle response regulator DivK